LFDRFHTASTRCGQYPWEKADAPVLEGNS
jgi:hypothetical protein